MGNKSGNLNKSTNQVVELDLETRQKMDTKRFRIIDELRVIIFCFI